MQNKAIFFDRDGIVNEPPAHGQYIEKWQDFVFRKEIKKILAFYKKKEWKLVLVTNQQAVAKKIMRIEVLLEIHNKMQLELKKSSANFDLVKFCPHFHGTCQCRKPLPGMLLQSAEELHLNLQKSWLIGDQDTDICAGKNAKVRTIRLKNDLPMQENADYFIDYLDEIFKIVDAEKVTK